MRVEINESMTLYITININTKEPTCVLTNGKKLFTVDNFAYTGLTVIDVSHNSNSDIIEGRAAMPQVQHPWLSGTNSKTSIKMYKTLYFNFYIWIRDISKKYELTKGHIEQFLQKIPGENI